jgi:hypothetical protein
MGRELDEMLQFVVVGAKPHCYRVLAFVMRRQRGESSEDAWRILDGGELEPSPPPQTAPKPRSPTPRAPKAQPPTPRAPHTRPTVTPQITTTAAPIPISPRLQATRPQSTFMFAPFNPSTAPQPVPRSSLFFTPTVAHRRPNSGSTGS